MRARIQTIYQRPRGVPIFQEAMEAVINEIWEVMWIFAFLCFSLAFCPTIWPAVDSLSTNDMNVLSVSKFKCFTDLQRGKRPRRFEVVKRIAKPETGKQDLFTTQRNLQPFWKFVTSHSPKESCIWKILTFSNFSKTKEFVQNTIIWFKAKSVLLRVGLNLWLQISVSCYLMFAKATNGFR
jgi:hypothetical protein